MSTDKKSMFFGTLARSSESVRPSAIAVLCSKIFLSTNELTHSLLVVDISLCSSILGTCEKARSIAAQLISAIKTQQTGLDQGN